jgi:CRP-like cAMP-binding protein
MTLLPLPTPAEEVSRRRLAKGEALFRQGDRTFAVFSVRRGRVRLVRHLADGSAVPLYVAHDGDTFAEAALFSPVYHCDAVADVDSEIEIHPKRALASALDDLPPAARALMENLAQQVIALRSRLEVRNIRSAAERVMRFLWLESGERDHCVTFERPLKDIAGEVGLTHETFYRTLARLEASGTIARDGRTVTLLKPA